MVGNITLFCAVVSAAPLCVLPAKDTCEEVFWKKNGMSKCFNVIVTFLIVFACYFSAIFIDGISDAMTLSGATIQPFAGFIIPIIFFWGIKRGTPFCSGPKLKSMVVVVFVFIICCFSMYNFIREKMETEPSPK